MSFKVSSSFCCISRIASIKRTKKNSPEFSHLDSSNTMIRISWCHRSWPKLAHQFSLLISHDAHRFENAFPENDRIHPNRVFVLFSVNSSKNSKNL
jgi:hypothetical protein